MDELPSRLKLIASGSSVGIEHSHGLGRQVLEILARHVELLEQVRGRRDDLTPAILRFIDVQDFAN